MSAEDAFRCPWCSHAHELEGMEPEPGAAVLCLQCGEWCIVGELPQLRRPTEAELLDLGEDDVARQVRAAWVLAVKPELAKRHRLN